MPFNTTSARLLDEIKGWQVSPYNGKNHSNYPVSPNEIELLSAMGETKIDGNFHENTQLIEIILNN